MKMIGLENPIAAMIAPVQIDPVQWALGQDDFMGDVALKRDASDDGIRQPFTKSSFRPMKIAAGKLPFKGGGAYGKPIQFDSRTRRITGDFQEGLRCN
jgi:hypothetical protein